MFNINSGVTRGLSQGKGSLAKEPTNAALKYEIIGRDFNDAEKSEQYSKAGA